jgi:TrmH family RNA methyltransferase
MLTRGASGRQIAGASDIEAALRAGAPIVLLLVQRDAKDPAVPELAGRAGGAGIRIREVSAGVLRRMSHVEPPAEILALVGRSPEAGLEDLLAGSGAVWLLVDVAYPGNVGMAIRTAEVSGADGIIIDAAFDHSGRKFALRTSVRTDWYMPVLWERANTVLDRAAATGRRIIGIEDVGTRAPWETDLTGRVLLIVGGETDGIPAALLERCDGIVRIPMAGFIPSYNVQAAVAAIATERLRQLGELS